MQISEPKSLWSCANTVWSLLNGFWLLPCHCRPYKLTVRWRLLFYEIKSKTKELQQAAFPNNGKNQEKLTNNKLHWRCLLATIACSTRNGRRFQGLVCLVRIKRLRRSFGSVNTATAKLIAESMPWDFAIASKKKRSPASEILTATGTRCTCQRFQWNDKFMAHFKFRLCHGYEASGSSQLAMDYANPIVQPTGLRIFQWSLMWHLSGISGSSMDSRLSSQKKLVALAWGTGADSFTGTAGIGAVFGATGLTEESVSWNKTETQKSRICDALHAHTRFLSVPVQATNLSKQCVTHIAACLYNSS